MSQDFLPGYGTPFRQLAPAASSACSQWPDSCLPHFSLVLLVGKRGHQGWGAGCGVEAEWVPWKEVPRAGCLQCEEAGGRGPGKFLTDSRDFFFSLIKIVIEN